MNRMLAAGAASLIAIACQAAGNTAATPQQQFVTACSADASTRQLRAPERSRFVSACVSEAKRRGHQAEKACSEAAAYKKPEERKRFMAECVKG